MADLRVSELAAATSIAGNELVPVVQGGANLSATPQLLQTQTYIERTADWTLALTDRNKDQLFNSASARVCTIPLNATVAFDVGDQVHFTRLGAGTATIDAESGVTLNGVDGDSIAIDAQYVWVRLKKIGTNAWTSSLVEGRTFTPTAHAASHQGGVDALPELAAQSTATWETGTGTDETVVSPAKVAAAIAALGGGGGLSHFIESQNTSSPNATVYVDALAAGGATTNVDVAIVPKGSGAFMLQIPDGTTAGGNKRGAGAVCLVTSRTNAAYGATGAGAFAVGPDSRALGQYAVAIGYNCAATQANGATSIGYSCNATGEFGSVAMGYLSTASGLSSAAIGIRCVASGVNSLATGSQSTTRSITGARAHASGRRAADGDRQRIDHLVSVTTSSTSATSLTADAGAASASNVMVLPNNSGAHFVARVTAYRSGGGAGSWEVCGTISRGANAASTALEGATTIRTFGVAASLGAPTVDVIADTTRGAAVVQVTAGNTDTTYWVADILLIQAA